MRSSRRQRFERKYARMRRCRVRRCEPLRVLLRTEIDALKQFGRQNHLCALPRSLADEAFRFRDVRGHERAIGGLNGRDRQHTLGHSSGSCWVMQWNEPPPASP